jgi:hypothetical protein
MTTEALIKVVKGSETIITLYCSNSGYPEYIGRNTKACLEKCVYANDHIFNNIQYREHFNQIGWDKTPETNKERMTLKIPLREIDFHVEGPADKCALDEYALAVRLCAGLFNVSNEMTYPNQIQIYHGKHPENIPYHYTISFRDFGNVEPPSVAKKPHIIVTLGYEGEVVYFGWIDYWDIPEDEDESVEPKFE